MRRLLRSVIIGCTIPKQNHTLHMKTNYRLALWLILLHALISHGPVAQAQSTGPGSALNLDGASGYGQVANGVWFNGNFTIEGWVYVRSYNNWSRFIDFAN